MFYGVLRGNSLGMSAFGGVGIYFNFFTCILSGMSIEHHSEFYLPAVR